MVRRSGMRHPGPPGAFTKREALDAPLGEDRFGRGEQRVAQVAMVIGARFTRLSRGSHPFCRHVPSLLLTVRFCQPSGPVLAAPLHTPDQPKCVRGQNGSRAAARLSSPDWVARLRRETCGGSRISRSTPLRESGGEVSPTPVTPSSAFTDKWSEAERQSRIELRRRRGGALDPASRLSLTRTGPLLSNRAIELHLDTVNKEAYRKILTLSKWRSQ